MDYALPKHSATGDYGHLTNFKKNCEEFETSTDCSTSCGLYNKANFPGCGKSWISVSPQESVQCVDIEDHLSHIRPSSPTEFPISEYKDGCIHLKVPTGGAKFSTLMRGDQYRFMLVPGVPVRPACPLLVGGVVAGGLGYAFVVKGPSPLRPTQRLSRPFQSI